MTGGATCPTVLEPIAPKQPAALRDLVLAGRHSLPEVSGFAGAMAAFLQQDRGALGAWLGPEEATQLAASPAQLRARLDADICCIDAMVSAQLDAILHDERFRRLEGSWRGLAWLSRQFQPGQSLRFMLLSAQWAELDRDLARAVEFDQSYLFRLVYEEEFGRAGGQPFGLLLIDHEVRHVPALRGAADREAPVDDVSVLAALSSVAAAAFVPIVVGASPALLGVDRFEDLALSHDIAGMFDGPDYARWRSLTGREDARFLAVTLPRVLARPRWCRPVRSLWYEEAAGDRPWFVAGYAFAMTVGRAFLAHAWPADVRGVGTDRVGGGLVLDLPHDTFVLGAATIWQRPATDLGLTDRQERDLVSAGFMPLNSLPYGDAAFTAVHSLQAQLADTPGREPTPYQANRRLSSQINAMLCVSRFAHHIKLIGRQLTGSFTAADEIEQRLRDWLGSYTNSSQSPTPDSRARHPLLSSAVQVHEVPGRPGSYGCVIHLQPYYQLDDVSATFRLVTGFGRPEAVA